MTPYDKDQAIHVVGDFTVRELVVTGADFQIRKDPKLEASCALVIWYDHDGDDEHPAVVEFSFNYKDKHEDYSRKAAERAYDAFQILQSKLNWIDSDSKTKTAYVYSRSGIKV